MRSRGIIAAAMLASAASTAASAADLGTIKGPLPVAPVESFSWTGPFVGAQLGYAWGHDVTKEYLTATHMFLGLQNYFRPTGFLGGIHAGYNYQFGSLVAGIEGDIEVADIHGGFTDPPAPPFNPGGYGATKINVQGSLRARLGYAFGRTMLYATGGLALAKIDSKYTNWGLVSETLSKTAAGFTVGGGVEHAVTNYLTLRAEYRFTEYQKWWNDSLVAFPGASGTQHPRNHSFRLGASYKF